MTAETHGGGITGRLWSLVRMWLDVTAQTATDEAKREASRLVTAVVLLLAAAAVLCVALLFAQVALVVLVQESTGWRWSLCVTVVAGPDALVAAILALVARAKLTKEWMPQTRAMVGKSARVLMG